MIVQPVKQNSTAFSAILNGPDIPDSSRNNTLTSIAGRLHDGTRSQEKLVEDLHKVNKARCKPPLPKSEVRRIAESIYKREPCRPGAAKPPEEVIEFVERQLAGVLEARAWKGVAGASDRKVYDALLEVAERHGWLLESGNVGVSISVRDLAELAGVSQSCCEAALARLQKAHLICRLPRTTGPMRCGAFALRNVAKVTQRRDTQQRERYSVGMSVPALSEKIEGLLRRLRHGPSRVTPTRGKRLRALLQLGGVATVKDIAKHIDCRPDNCRRDMSYLESRGLVEEIRKDTYRAADNLEQRLEAVLEEDGVPETERAQHQRAEADRGMYAYWFMLREAAKRGENLEEVTPPALVVELPFIGSAEEVYESSAVEPTPTPPLPECGHGYVGGKGCFLHDPDHPYRRELREAEERVLEEAA